ncbi:cytochrome c biogenesis CcdA family protein [Leucobacter triazinivorans]|uniref:Cytochrome c biogenesis protein CcdA n=1 Tax=Leucobacter triazinivorans TaxID=1784719 RepID=A0A4P6KFR3_9MICO|nr:cytochrome c biogenesis CcdA family protein [Leucobacter triazinivorans]QBE49277.1 cytochrome c biogenesis protein CcdA [Leucobacter triazinivorans]
MEIGFVTAFIGGALALLSPCSALLLPAFFASTIGTRLSLLAHGAVFFLGLLITLVPLGLGLGAVGTFFLQQRGLVVAGTSLVLVLLGIAQVLGIGFDVSRALPGTTRIRQEAAARTGFIRTFLLGAASGVAGFCAGPILGAVLTLALGQGSAWSAGALLAVYGAGMVAPLVLIAALWDRLGARGQRLLRGRTLSLFGRRLHSTSLVTGLVIIAVGVVFWLTNGLVAMPAVVPTSVQVWAQEQSGRLSSAIVDGAVIMVLAIAALGAWASARRRAARREETRSAGNRGRTPASGAD